MATRTVGTTAIALLIGALAIPSLEAAGASDATASNFSPATQSRTVAVVAPSFSEAADEAAYKWAQGIFSTAGFDFPTVGIEFHSDEDSCGGVRGRTYLASDDLATIVVCATHRNPEVEAAWRQRTLLHELAHAWIDQSVEDKRTSALMTLRNTATWLGRDHPWQNRGAEHAAEIFMWGVLEGAYTPDFRLSDTQCDELSAAYQLLTDISVRCDEIGA